jgi:hypothetical protein
VGTAHRFDMDSLTFTPPHYLPSYVSLGMFQNAVMLFCDDRQIELSIACVNVYKALRLGTDGSDAFGSFHATTSDSTGRPRYDDVRIVEAYDDCDGIEKTRFIAGTIYAFVEIYVPVLEEDDASIKEQVYTLALVRGYKALVEETGAASSRSTKRRKVEPVFDLQSPAMYAGGVQGVPFPVIVPAPEFLWLIDADSISCGLWTVACPERAAAGVRWIITNPLNNALELQVSDMVGEQEAGEGEQKDEY